MVSRNIAALKDEGHRRERAMNKMNGAMLLFVHFRGWIADLDRLNGRRVKDNS
jgi:hypothetical protein